MGCVWVGGWVGGWVCVVWVWVWVCVCVCVCEPQLLLDCLSHCTHSMKIGAVFLLCSCFSNSLYVKLASFYSIRKLSFF